MTTKALSPDGAPVRIDDVVIVSPGLRGNATVTRPGAPDAATRSAAVVGTGDLNRALDDAGMSELLTIDITDAVELPAAAALETRSTPTGEPALEVLVPAPAPAPDPVAGRQFGQVMMAVDERGVVTWIVGQDVPSTGDAGGAGLRSYVVPREVTAPPADSGDRGILGAIGRKILKVIAFELIDRVAHAAGNHFVKAFEDANRPHRLRRFLPGTQQRDDVDALTTADLRAFGGDRALLLVHGTNSQSHSGLGRIPDATLQTLHGRYGDRVFAFDHPTLSVEPTVNAQWFADMLPSDVDFSLDIISHSRGGLVSRILAERPAAVGLDPQRFRVETLVMVATPNAGTPLAKPEHVLKFVDVITTILNVVPDNPVTSILEVLLPLVKQVAVNVLDGFDGLISMQESGPYLAWLNGTSGRTTSAARTRVIVSNFQPIKGTALSRVALDLAADALFLLRSNDLVVPTEGAYAYPGAPVFGPGESLVLDAASGVDHSSYWWTQQVDDQFLAWLQP